MNLFKEMDNTQAYLKCGIMGFAGAGKSTTATNIAIGLVELLRERGLESGNKPVLFLDTESGADWVKPLFTQSDIRLMVSKTRAFTDLVTAVKEAEASGSVLIIDSISHFWTELCESYAKKKNRKYGLQFQDWSVLKSTWRGFTDAFVNSNVHIIICGRAGYEYDFIDNGGSKKELQKTDIKMKAENETGYESSLLILMERHQKLDDNSNLSLQYRTATIRKDRSRTIDGKVFNNPKFYDFLPHIEFLNLGGQQLGVDVDRNSEHLFDKDGNTNWQLQRKRKEIALDETKEILTKHYPGQAADAKAMKGDLLEKNFGTRSWVKIENLAWDLVENGRNTLWKELTGEDYIYVAPENDPGLDDEIPSFDG